LDTFAGDVFSALARKGQRATAGVYVRGLMLDGTRKSMQPVALQLRVDHQRLQQFLTTALAHPRLLPDRGQPEPRVRIVGSTTVPARELGTVGPARTPPAVVADAVNGATSAYSGDHGQYLVARLARIDPTRSPFSERRLLATPTPFQSQIYRSLPEIERADAIVDRISKAIALGLLKVGERLPPEAVLSEMFGVGGATLREALAELRERGVVETRRGRSGGTFVVNQPKTQTDIMRDWFLSTTISEIRDIGDEHSAIAAATIRLACERAEAHDFERLQELGRALVLAKTPEARAPADSRFHVELAVSAQSPRLANAEIRLQEETVRQLWTPLITTVTFDPEQATAEHLELVRAVAQDQPERAQKLAIEHIRRNIFHLIDTKLTLGYSQSSSSIPATVTDTNSSGEVKTRSTPSKSSHRAPASSTRSTIQEG
jgi:DNA-binding FadR family transcriptional regulator